MYNENINMKTATKTLLHFISWLYLILRFLISAAGQTDLIFTRMIMLMLAVVKLHNPHINYHQTKAF